MNQKRARSINWDEEEKQLFRSVLKEYAEIIENKSLDTNTNKTKSKAWEDVHKKFNELNGRHRQLSQLKVQWKSMKVNARKTYYQFKNNVNKTGGGTRPKTPDDAVIQIKDLLNPAELLRDQNIYDSDGIIASISDNKVVSETTSEATVITLQEPESVTYVLTPVNSPCVNDNVNTENQVTDNTCVQKNEDVEVQFIQEGTPILNSQDCVTPMAKNVDRFPAKVLKRKFYTNTENILKNKKNHEDYVSSMVRHSKMLKDEQHMRTMEMAEEEHLIKMENLREMAKEHLIKMEILKENLKSAILEREILEIKKRNLE